MKTKLLILLFLASLSTYSQYTAIPDVNFENKLISLGIDSGVSDGQVLTSSINTLTSLDVSRSSITDLTGIQDFKALTILECQYNNFNTLDLSKNTLLSKLDCSYNSILNLDVSNNVNLTYLDCTSSSVTAFDISSNIALEYLHCGNNGNRTNTFTVLDLSKNTNLKQLDISYGFLSNLDLTTNIALEKLNCNSNNLSSLDLSANTALTTLFCEDNNLLELKTVTNNQLKYLDCSNNKITSLDLSSNSNLLLLNCVANNLISLNLKNGNNANLLATSGIYFQYMYGNLGRDFSTSFIRNRDLYCILVDDVDYSNTNWETKKEAFAYYSPIDCSQVTQIPDPSFEDKLIALSIDKDGKNGVVLNTSIANITTLDVSNSAITDLKGIEGFTALTALNCSGNLLKKIDLSKNAVFTNLDCSDNTALICIQVADIDYATANWTVNKDVTANFSLDCTIYTLIPDSKFEDKLIALGIDKDGKNGKVATESISKLTTLDISKSLITDLTGIQDFSSLTFLSCSENLLTTLDVSKNLALTRLQCYYNNLTTLDISKNAALNYLYCFNNQLTALDVAMNTNLIDLSCYSNQLTALDVSKNVTLKNLVCNSNKLLSLNIKNGNNSQFVYFDIKTNPNLKCILVDDVTYSNTNWLNKKDATAFFSSYDCSTVTGIPDAKFEDKLIELGIDTDGKNGFVLTASVTALTTLDVSNSSITDLTGIEDFTSLTSLDCSKNQLKKLELTNNAVITALNCSTNPDLLCIKVADIAVANNWATTKDATTSFNIDCTIYTQIPDSKFEDKLIALNIDKDGKNGKVATESISKLTTLDVSHSLITDLTGIQDFTSLTFLSCSENLLTTLDVSKNIALTRLQCYQNNLTTLDVSKNAALNYLYCPNNQLTTLDVAMNTNLIDLSCHYNQLTALDVSKNVTLKNLISNSNKLLSLNVKNGNNSQFVYFDTKTNPNLKCILVDDVTYANTNWSTQKDATATYNTDCTPYTLIPDSNFEDKLIALNIDTDGKNGKVKTESIASITSLEVFNSSIANLSGIEDFVSLTTLDCSGNNLTALDVTKNTALTYLDCSTNSITGLDVTKNTGITELYCNTNLLAVLDVKNNVLLSKLNCSDNTITSLDLSKNTALTEIKCFKNNLISLDLKNGNNTSLQNMTLGNLAQNPDLKCIQVDDAAYSDSNWEAKDATASYNIDCTIYTLIPDPIFEDKLIVLNIDKDGKNGKVASESIAAITSLNIANSSITDLTGIEDFKALQTLRCYNNLLTALDVSKNAALVHLECDSNKLTSLDVSKNIALNHLECQVNLLTTLDVSKNIALAKILCYSNKLTSLNLKNGTNTLLVNANVSFGSNPNLKCILVDDVTYADTNWSNKKDATATYNTDCTPSTLIPDSNFEDKLIALGIDTDGKNGKVFTSSIASITTLEVYSSNISDLTGIEDFVSLTSLDCSDNNLTALNVTKNTALTYLDCSLNSIAALDVSKNTGLTELYCNTNQLAVLDVQNNVSLSKLNCSDNVIASLDLSKNTVLTAIKCFKNNLTSLDLKNGNNTNLLSMYFGNLAQNPNLKCIQVDNAAFCNANWEAKDATAGYSSDCTAFANTYTTIPDSNFEDKLIALEIDKDGKNGKVLTSSIFTIGTLDVSNSNITDLTGIEDFKMLTSLTCGNNAITALDVSKNQSLDKLYCSFNNINTLDVSSNTALTILSCSFNMLTTLNVSANTALKQLECSNNNLTYLNIQNGNNTNMQSMIFGNFTTNPKLTCILVDDADYSTDNWGLAKDAIANYNTDCTTYTLIPDSNFEDKLIALGIDTDGKNGKVKTESIASITSIDVSSSAIKNLSGIEDFTSLTTLNCSTNELTSLTPENNPLLTELNCSYNAITVIDVAKNPALIAINVSNNSLTSLNLKNGFNTNLDAFVVNFTQNPSLSCIQVDDVNYSNNNWNGRLDETSFFAKDCSNFTLIPDSNFEDKLIALNIDIDGKNGKVLTSSIAEITQLNVQISEITDLTGIEGFTSLEYLSCQFNPLTTIDVSKNLNLIELYCHGNSLTSLNVSANTELTTLYCNKNELTELDISSNTKLVYIHAAENALQTLNLKNGNNVNFDTAYLFKNPELTCILVDDPAFASTSSAFTKDDTAIYSSTCTLGLEDSVFDKVSIYPNPTKGELHIDNIVLEKATVYDALGKLVKTAAFTSGANTNTIHLEGSPTGIYYIYLESEGANTAKKIIVE